jgi:hypothetical protein
MRVVPPVAAERDLGTVELGGPGLRAAPAIPELRPEQDALVKVNLKKGEALDITLIGANSIFNADRNKRGPGLCADYGKDEAWNEFGIEVRTVRSLEREPVARYHCRGPVINPPDPQVDSSLLWSEADFTFTAAQDGDHWIRVVNDYPFVTPARSYRLFMSKSIVTQAPNRPGVGTLVPRQKFVWSTPAESGRITLGMTIPDCWNDRRFFVEKVEALDSTGRNVLRTWDQQGSTTVPAEQAERFCNSTGNYWLMNLPSGTKMVRLSAQNRSIDELNLPTVTLMRDSVQGTLNVTPAVSVQSLSPGQRATWTYRPSTTERFGATFNPVTACSKFTRDAPLLRIVRNADGVVVASAHCGRFGPRFNADVTFEGIARELYRIELINLGPQPLGGGAKIRRCDKSCT